MQTCTEYNIEGKPLEETNQLVLRLPTTSTGML